MSDRTTHWENVYATKGETEVSWYQDNPAISLAMIRAANSDHDAAIIDIGGGASRLVDALLQDGYRRLAVLDLSANALDMVKKRIGQAASTVDWIVADATTWRPTRTYDVWHDRAAFHFLTDPDDRAAYRCSATTAPALRLNSGRRSSWSRRGARYTTHRGIRRRRFSSAGFGGGAHK